MGPWQKIGEGTPPANALLLFYMPGGFYLWTSSKEAEEVKRDYPKMTHYCVMVEEPGN